jgi:methionine aminotransferase
MSPEDYTAEIRKIHKYICNYGNAAVQHAMAELITSDKEFLESVRDEYKAKRDLLCSLLEGSGYKLIPSQGSWYQMVDISAITKENDISFAQRLAREFGLAVVPMSVYYHDRNRSSIVRICFARPDKVIKEGVKRLLKARKIN